MNTNPAQIKVGALLFAGFELLDVYGPLEMFGMLGEQVRILMLAESPGNIQSNQGPWSVAESTLADARDLDVLLVPGGMGTRREVTNQKLLDELQRQSGKARFVASVCTGSALLAKAGVLDGKRAFKCVMEQGPKVNWVAEARWVEDGKFFTSSGVSAGMDMALGLIARLFDTDTSMRIANRAEYEWHANSKWDPFARLNNLEVKK